MAKRLCVYSTFETRLLRQRWSRSFVPKPCRKRFCSTAVKSSLHDHKPDSPTSNESTIVYPNVEYMHIEDVERLERYCPGGYHPTTIGDRLHDRYVIVHKLGFGGYSTIWLARDEKTKQYVALKIATASDDMQDSQILRLLNSSTKNEMHTGKATISSILDGFFIKGPNGRHHCFVRAPGMVSLAGAKDGSYNRLFQLPTARAISAQLILAVVFLHSQGVVHGGMLLSFLLLIVHSLLFYFSNDWDAFMPVFLTNKLVIDLHKGNILHFLPEGINHLSIDELYKKYRKPKLEPVERLDSKPLPNGITTHAVVPVWLGKPSHQMAVPEARILLADFGESFLPSLTSRHHSNTPSLLAPPETHLSSLQIPISFPADIWTLGCTLFEIVGQIPIFEGFDPGSDWMIREHIDAIGKLPSEWWEKWNARSEWFSENGVRSRGTSRDLEERFHVSMEAPRQRNKMPAIEEDEKVALLELLRLMLVFEPDKRLTAVEILETEWVRKWAMPALKEVSVPMISLYRNTNGTISPLRVSALYLTIWQRGGIELSAMYT